MVIGVNSRWPHCRHADGTNMEIFQGYFVPLHLYKLKPTSTEEKMENMNFAFRF